MEVRTVRNWTELESIRDEWSDLLVRSRSNRPTLSPAWLHAWWEIFGLFDARELCVQLFYSDGRLVGIAPLLRRLVVYRKSIPLWRIELIGSGEPEEDEICSDYIGLIAERGWEQTIADALAERLLNGDLGYWNELSLTLMDGESLMTRATTVALESRGIPTSVCSDSSCFHIPLPDSWDEYLTQLSSSRRYRVRRSVRDFEKWADGDVNVRIVQSTDDFDEALETLIRLHRERWHHDGRPGVFDSMRFRFFHESVMPQLLESGHLELMTLSVRNEPVAALYNIVWDGIVHFYQSGRRMDLPDKLRPGIAMHAFAIQHAIERGRRTYDFLSGSSRYKQELALAETPLVSVRATRPGSVRGLARNYASKVGSLLRQVRNGMRRS